MDVIIFQIVIASYLVPLNTFENRCYNIVRVLPYLIPIGVIVVHS